MHVGCSKDIVTASKEDLRRKEIRVTIGLVGKKLQYSYGNGWEYHVHYVSENKVSYHVVSGPFGGRSATQDAHYAEVAPDTYMVSWYEETGTIVSTVVNLEARTITGFVAFPRWVYDNPEWTHGRKEEKESELLRLRSTEQDAPREIVFESANIHSVEDA